MPIFQKRPKSYDWVRFKGRKKRHTERSGQPVQDGTPPQVPREAGEGSINQQIPPAYYLP